MQQQLKARQRGASIIVVLFIVGVLAFIGRLGAEFRLDQYAITAGAPASYPDGGVPVLDATGQPTTRKAGVGAQVFPTYTEYQAIQKAVNKAGAGTSPAEARLIYEKAMSVDDIKSVQPKDLEVTPDNGKMLVSFAYTKEIHLFGPAFLLMKYAGKSK